MPWLWGDAASRMLAWSSRAPRVHLPPQERWARLLLMCRAPLLSRAAGPEPSARRPEQRDLYAAPSPRARGLPGPVFFSSRAAGIQWAETLPPGPLRRHKCPFSTGAAEDPRWRGELEGERPGLLQRPDCVLGPGAHRAWAAVAGANLSRRGSCGERGRGRLRPTGEG